MELNKEKGFFLIPNFENYVIDVKRFKIKSMITNKEIKPLSNLNHVKFKLSRNGQAYYLTLIDIIESVIKKYF